MPCLRRATRDASTEEVGGGEEFDVVCAGNNREPKQARRITNWMWRKIREHFIFPLTHNWQGPNSFSVTMAIGHHPTQLRLPNPVEIENEDFANPGLKIRRTCADKVYRVVCIRISTHMCSADSARQV